MKPVQIYHIIALCLATLFLVSCADDDNTSNLTSDPATRQLLTNEAISLDAGGESVTLYLNDNGTPWESVLKDAGEEHYAWCRSAIIPTGDGYKVVVTAQRNDNINRRAATLRLSRGNTTKLLTITQKGYPRMQAFKQHVDVRNDSRNVFVVIHTNVTPHIDTTNTAGWLHFVGMQREDHTPDAANDSMTLVCYFTVKANTDLGRMTAVTFRNDSAAPLSVNIHQWGRRLNASETIHLDQPGQLPTLLGGNGYAWTDLDSLTLSGKINTDDINALRILLTPYIRVAQTNERGNFTVTSDCYLHLRHLDLGQCTIVGGGKADMEESIVTRLPDTYLNADNNTLADCAFKLTRTLLESIVLPRNLEKIGGWAFYYCANLQRIDIPATVRHIGPYAFANCTSLAEINLTDDSRLEYLGIYALNSGSGFAEIRLPRSLQITENEGPILGSPSTKNIHLRWPEPPVLTRFGVNKTVTLYVPRGSGDAYRAAAGWNRAKEIIEE